VDSQVCSHARFLNQGKETCEIILAQQKSSYKAERTHYVLIRLTIFGLPPHLSLLADFATEEPCTMLLADFFLHETQYSRPMLGIAPSSELRREMEVLADSIFLTYLRDEALTVQLLRVRGADFEPLATLRLPLAAMLTSGQTSVKMTSAELKSASGSLVGRIDVSADIEGGSIAAQAKAFLEAAKGGGEAVGRVSDANVQVCFLVCACACLRFCMHAFVCCSCDMETKRARRDFFYKFSACMFSRSYTPLCVRLKMMYIFD